MEESEMLEAMRILLEAVEPKAGEFMFLEGSWYQMGADGEWHEFTGQTSLYE